MPRTPEQFQEIRSDRKKAILDAALHVFSEQGYHNASISQISKEARVSKGLMYNYFENKEELLKILISSLLDKEVESMNRLLKNKITEETMIEFMSLTTNVLKSKPKKWKLYFKMSSQPEVLKIVEDKFAESGALFSKKIMEFFQNKGCSDPVMTFTYFTTAITGLKISYIMQPETYPIDKMEELIIKQFITS